MSEVSVKTVGQYPSCALVRPFAKVPQTLFVATDSVVKSIARHNRKLAKRAECRSEEQLQGNWKQCIKGEPATITLESFLADVSSYETVERRTLELRPRVSTPKKEKRTKDNVKIARRAKHTTGSIPKREKRRRVQTDHAVGKTENIIRLGYDDARQEAAIYLLVNKRDVSLLDMKVETFRVDGRLETLVTLHGEVIPPSEIREEMVRTMRRAWLNGWSKYKRSVIGTRKENVSHTSLICSHLDNLVALPVTSRLTWATIREICRMVPDGKGRILTKQLRIVTYLALLGENIQQIADRLKLTRDVVVTRLMHARAALAKHQSKIADAIEFGTLR